MNNYFKSFMNLDTSLKEFGEQFNQALAKRVEAEAAETFRMDDAPLVCRYEFPMEVIFCSIYTKVKVQALQKELAGVSYLVVHPREPKNGVHRYIIQDRCSRCKWKSPLETFYKVSFNPATIRIKCACRFFEFTGILCRHIVCIFQVENVEDVPERYIVPRWRRDVPRGYLNFSIPGTSPEAMGPEPAIYCGLRSHFEDVAKIVVGNPLLTFEMEAYMRDLQIRGMAMLQNHAAFEVVPGEGFGGSTYKKKRRSVCPHPLPTFAHLQAEEPEDGLVAGLEPGKDPIPRRGPGRIPGHRLGYNGGGRGRGRGRGRGGSGEGSSQGEQAGMFQIPWTQ